MDSDRNLYVVATDGNEAARDAVRYVKPLLEPDRDRLLGLRVINPFPVDEWPWEDIKALENPEPVMRELKTEASDQLRDDFEPLVDQGFEVEFHVEEGDAGEAICGMAARNNARGIVMGQRDRDNNDDVLIGSVSNYVIHHAPCPVVVVPGRNGEDLNNPMDLDQT